MAVTLASPVLYEILDDVSLHISTSNEKLLQKISSLEDDLKNMKIINNFLQDQAHDKSEELNKLHAELREKDGMIKVRAQCII